QLNNFLELFPLPGFARVKTFESWTRYHSLNTSALTTIARASRRVQIIVPPFSRNAVKTNNRFTIDDNPTSYSGAHDHAKNNSCIGKPVSYHPHTRLRQGEAIGIVSQSNRNPKPFLYVLAHRLSVHHD